MKELQITTEGGRTFVLSIGMMVFIALALAVAITIPTLYFTGVITDDHRGLSRQEKIAQCINENYEGDWSYLADCISIVG